MKVHPDPRIRYLGLTLMVVGLAQIVLGLLLIAGVLR